MAISASPFIHEITQLTVYPDQPEGLTAANLSSVYKRIARKAGYELHQGNQFLPQSKLSKFNYFSAGARNANTSARAYYESGHLLTAAILRENHQAREKLLDEGINATGKDPIWASFSKNPAVQRNFKRQDYINHRPHMLGPSNKTSRIATIFAQKAMNVWECTCAPTGFGYKMIRNSIFHGVSEKGLINKASTVALSVVIGLGATTLIKAIRGAAGTSGYGFNPLQILTGVLVSFAAVSATAGLVSWVSGLVSQTKLKNLDPTDEQKQFIQFEMDSTLNKMNELLLDSLNNAGKMTLLSKAMTKKFPNASTIENTIQNKTIHLHPMLNEWRNTLVTKTETAKLGATTKNPTPTPTPAQYLLATKEFLGRYLNNGATLRELIQNEGAQSPIHISQKQQMRREQEFATLAGFVEHLEVEPTALNPAAKAKAEKDGRTPQTLRTSRMDGRTFLENFAKSINQAVLRGLAMSAKGVLGRNHTWSQKLKKLASPEYTKLKTARLADPARAHLNKYDTEYIAKNLHQYGPITRALMTASDFINNINYNYVLAVNTQTSRLLTNIPMLIQKHLLGQHNSHIMCNAFGRFLGSATVTLVSFFGISALAGLTGGGNPSDGFQNMSSAGNAKLSWLVTGTLMTLIGVPAFALGLMAKGAAALEGWKGNIEKPLPSRAHNLGQLITI